MQPRRTSTSGPLRAKPDLTQPAAEIVSIGVESAVELRRGESLALLAALSTVVLWASAFVGIRAAGRSFSPEALALGRLLAACSVLGLLALVRREPLPVRSDLTRIAAYGGALARRVQRRAQRGREARRGAAPAQFEPFRGHTPTLEDRVVEPISMHTDRHYRLHLRDRVEPRELSLFGGKATCLMAVGLSGRGGSSLGIDKCDGGHRDAGP
jgi:hypothetical protein